MAIQASDPQRGLTTGSLRRQTDVARDQLMGLAGEKGFNVDPLEAGGFANRDAINQQIRSASQDEKRLKRAANLAYRDAVRRGDRAGALSVLLGARREGISFGGISPAGQAERNVIQQQGEDFITAAQRQQGAPQKKPAEDMGFTNFILGGGANQEQAILPGLVEYEVPQVGPPPQAQGSNPVSQPSRFGMLGKEFDERESLKKGITSLGEAALAPASFLSKEAGKVGEMAKESARQLKDIGKGLFSEFQEASEKKEVEIGGVKMRLNRREEDIMKKRWEATKQAYSKSSQKARWRERVERIKAGQEKMIPDQNKSSFESLFRQ